MGGEEFEEFLFMVSRDVDDELNDFASSEGDAQIAQWLVQILSNWRVRAQSMSHKDQDTVLWRIGSNPLFLGWKLESASKLNFDEQCEVVRAAKCVTLAIPFLFGPEEPMERGYYMWWDLLISGVDDRGIGSVILETLSDLSLHSDERVQLSALHGLGHLQHPGRAAAIDRYIHFRPEMASDPWIRQCRDGSVM
ncbi:hypothetical protein [Fimbriimonas ginsengisoli]|uniref:HEAT repeat domain-containing protein n=1 Tax=Fimbriimonas ginsengisoli Gsoil 348 TaxID=661478 RepID=A0A068NUT0_FIMGI|nr:hypothetical protein [Fimbriimonas ginsengisoli]AIE87201.1 hypothetical protein OP10G_3833 [Fimbriimonas ginsengisoli Gsoil 348]